MSESNADFIKRARVLLKHPDPEFLSAAKVALPEALERLAAADAERDWLRAEVERCNGTVEQLRYALRIAQTARQLGIPPS